MDISQYVKLLKVVGGSPRLMCTYCGVETPAAGDIGICSNCECIIHTGRQALRGRDAELAGKLESINKFIESRSFDQAIAVYDGMKSDTEEPQLLYAEALAYIKYSNYEISKISYDRPGFMEENTSHRDKGSKLASAAKLLLTRGISIANDEIAKGNTSVNLLYTLFLLHLKMRNAKGAAYALKMLGGTAAGYAQSYASVAFAASNEDYDGIIRLTDEMIKSNQTPLNMFYYVAYALFKRNDPRGATALLKELQPYIKSQNVGALIADIDDTQKV